MKTIGMCNQKGGVGKTATTAQLARAAVRQGFRVLVVDADPQGNATSALAAADIAAAVTEADRFASHGLVQLIETIGLVRQHYRPSLRLTGVIVNRYRPREREARTWLEELRGASEAMGFPLLDPRSRTARASPTRWPPVPASTNGPPCLARSETSSRTCTPPICTPSLRRHDLMATTDKPRKTSPFAGGSPVEPAASAPAPTPAREERIPAPAAASSGKKYPPKVTFYQPQDDTARMRGAFRHTDREEGDRSLSDFIHKAVMAEVERREGKYNNGKPFPDLEAGSIPRGRSMGE